MLSQLMSGDFGGPPHTSQPSLFMPKLEGAQNTTNEQLGESYQSMNLEELLKTSWTGEERYVGATMVAPPGESDSLNKQSNVSLSSACLKTSDEVWRDIVRQPMANLADKQSQNEVSQGQSMTSLVGNSEQNEDSQQIQGIGEMTLEDFLVKSGFVRKDPAAENNNGIVLYPSVATGSVSDNLCPAIETMASQGVQPDWMKYPSHHNQHQRLLQHAEATAAAKLGFCSPSLMLPAGSPMYNGLADSMVLAQDSFANSLPLSPSFSDYSAYGRKRPTSEVVVEKNLERRQKRMIKNRESAARSRARKQAYTVELEAEVTMLKEENARLKRQQVLLGHLPDQVSKLRVLRRTRSF